MSTRSEPLDPALIGPDRPIADKLTLQILPEDRDHLDVTLGLVLDPSQPDEQAAIDAFAPDGCLEVRHLAELNLEAERNALSDRFTHLYRKSELAADLRAPQLVSLREPAEKANQLRRAMMPVAVRGRSVYRRLLEPGELLNYSDADAPLVRAALRSALRRDHLVVIKSPVSLFPWTFLYGGEGLDKDDLTTLDLTRFWGFRHQIQEEVEGASPRVRLPGAPVIAAAVSPDQDAAAEHRRGPLGKLAEGAPERVQWIDSAAKLRGAITHFPGDCLYFFGHALQDDPPTPTTSALRLQDLDVTVEEICEERGPRFDRPLVLVFLNGCETTPLNVWNKDSFVGLLCLRGDRRVCCVSTFAEVPAAFARRFAQRFWERFLDKATLGAALLGARRDLLEELLSPLGLVYTLFGRIETRIG